MPKLLLLTRLPFYPDAKGGAEYSTIYLLKSLQQLGWEVEVICSCLFRSPSFWRSCWQTLTRLQKPSMCMKDESLGYPCWRQLRKFSSDHQWIACLDRRLNEYQPDFVISHHLDFLLEHAARRGYSSFYFVRWVNADSPGTGIPDGIHLITNSPFTAKVAAQIAQKEVGIVLPFIEQEQYRVTKRERRYITLVNPVPEKGVDIALEIARRLPQERFLFVKGKWAKYSAKKREAFIKNAYSLPNVEIWEHQQDMRRVYAVTDILLVPSQFNETFGRVIVEAHINGIPVVAAQVGGIPYVLGKGGILIEPKDEPQVYVDALRQLHTDETSYQELSALALQNSQRPEFDPQYQIENFVRFVENSKLIEAKKLQTDTATKYMSY